MSVVNCCTCAVRVPLDQAHAVKRDTSSGRAMRCNACGDVALATLRDLNARQLAVTAHTDGA